MEWPPLSIGGHGLLEVPGEVAADTAEILDLSTR